MDVLKAKSHCKHHLGIWMYRHSYATYETWEEMIYINEFGGLDGYVKGVDSIC
jgi:hypothetical protein